MSFDRSKLYIYRSHIGGYFATCTKCRGEHNHNLGESSGESSGAWLGTVTDTGKTSSQLTADNIERGFTRHIAYHAENDVTEKAPLDDPVDELKELLDGLVKEYAPKLQKALTDFGLKQFLK